MALTFEPITLSLFTILFACLISLYFYFTRNFNFWKKLGIPYVKPLPFVGNVKDVVLQKVNIGNSLKTFYDDHSDKPYMGIFVFDQPILVIRDLDLVKNILVKDAHNFIDRTISGSVDWKDDVRDKGTALAPRQIELDSGIYVFENEDNVSPGGNMREGTGEMPGEGHG
jgi:hypothetical protein